MERIEEEKNMNVKELIEYLSAVEDPENTAVVLEGCDCYGAWNGKAEIEQNKYYEPYDKYLLLNRYH